jgi:hypothetical protein
MGAAGLCYTSLFPKSRKPKRLTAYTEQLPMILGMIIIWSIQRLSIPCPTLLPESTTTYIIIG